MAGLIIFIIIILWSTKKIVKIEIHGNEYYASTEIYEFLTENNIDYGSVVKNISCKDIEKLMLNRFDLLTFVSVHINGNTLIITVKENKTVKQEKEDETPCNQSCHKKIAVSVIKNKKSRPVLFTDTDSYACNLCEAFYLFKILGKHHTFCGI